MRSNVFLKSSVILIIFVGIALCTINACKKDNDVPSKKETKQVEENIIARVGGTLATSDSIHLVIPPNALPNDGTVFVGRTGSEPTSVPNPNLQIVGNPITIRISSDSINNAIQLTFPANFASINTDNYCMFLYNGTTYFPVEYALNGNAVTVSIDKINWESVDNIKSLVPGIGEIVVIALKNKETPPISEMGLKEVTFQSGKLNPTAPQLVNSSSKVLLLIHGLFSGPSQCWSSFIPKIQKETNPAYTNYWTFGYNTSLSINQNAEILSNLLATYANGAQIDIIAHSMGGLVSRAMIEQYNGKKFISKLITLDTPHQGAMVRAIRTAIGAIATLVTDPMDAILIANFTNTGIRDLDNNSALIQQMMNLQNPPLPYYAITATGDPSFLLSKIIPGLDDGVVSVVSARGVQGAVSPASDVNIPVALAHLKVTENDDIYAQLLNYLKRPSDNGLIFNPNLTYGTMSDIDGNVYKTIQIGTQTWMAENLKTTKYRNGDPIPNVTDATAWAALTNGAYCWYNNDASSNKATYGALYNWYSISDSRAIAPSGWHIPIDNEWSTLANYLGDVYTAGGKLKETGTTHWQNPNTGATNATGFTAIPDGQRNYDGTFSQVGYQSWWWNCSTVGILVESYGLFYNDSEMASGAEGGSRTVGRPVRCIKD